MERLSESNYRSLAEAYSKVYSEDNGTELTEDQQIHEFLEVVNSLVEEGYDLSEYTYDELYEYYVSEGLGGRIASAAKDVLVKTAQKYGPRALQTVKRGAKEVGKIPVQGTKNIVKGVIKPLQTKAGSVAATLAGLEAVLAGEKSLTRKALGKAGEGLQSLGRAVYGDNESQKPKQEKPKASGNPLGLNQDVDLFDLIKGHLIDEGYAETEEAALKIMANMGEEWKQSILEGMGLSVGVSKLAGNAFSNPRTSPEQGARNFQKNVADPVGHAVKGAVKSVLGVGDEKNKQMMQKRRQN